MESTVQLYQEISSILQESVDESLPLNIQADLYESKLAFLQNLLQQALRDVNTSRTEFAYEDIVTLRNAIELTKQHQAECVRRIFIQTLEGLKVAA